MTIIGMGYQNVIEILQARARQQPNDRIFVFLKDGETESAELTYFQLDRQARVIAAHLQSLNLAGERALLLYPSGLEFISAFLGCLYAGVIAVPAYPPRPNRSFQRIQSIIQDAQAIAILTTSTLYPSLASKLAPRLPPQFQHWIATDTLTFDLAPQWQKVSIQSETIALLQYTSGSTNEPKGIMVSHGNLIHNQRQIQQIFGHDHQSIVVGWLPLFHDMGLIGNVLQPLYLGSQAILMSPIDFLQKPLRWLKAISHYQAHTSGGPNFAYDLCLSKISLEQREQLDLRSWQVAFNGAEPIRAETLQKFRDYFLPCGLSRTALTPCYGMAEATLMITAKPQGTEPLFLSLDSQHLQQNQVKLNQATTSYHLVGVGQSQNHCQIVIVDPETYRTCDSDQVGEIWITGKSVAQGYWRNTRASRESFQAYLKDTGQGPFLRTGDLGFLYKGELWITGRLKEIIIIRGANYYPQDLEILAQQNHPALRLNGGAAFAVEKNGIEQLVLVQEIERSYLNNPPIEEIATVVRQAIAAEYDLHLQTLVLIKPASLPKTSSGKIKRVACRADFLQQRLPILAKWESSQGELDRAFLATDICPQSNFSQADIASWLQMRLAVYLRLSPDKIDIEQCFDYYGMDSVQVVSAMEDLSAWLGENFDATLFWQYPSIAALSEHLASQKNSRQTRP
jgi:acyl-CoA synthetase (AMP-forming)/AMP-acid ligase II/acyl carrier protein